MVPVDSNMGNSKERGWRIRGLLQSEAHFICSQLLGLPFLLCNPLNKTVANCCYYNINL
jgi:hypothetical protein